MTYFLFWEWTTRNSQKRRPSLAIGNIHRYLLKYNSAEGTGVLWTIMYMYSILAFVLCGVLTDDGHLHDYATQYHLDDDIVRVSDRCELTY